MRKLRICLLLPLFVLTGCQSPGPRAAQMPAGCEAPLFDGLGDHHRPIGASVPLAQRYFDQGLTLAYAFNHDEAIRSFEQAARLDPDNPMPWWGVALCHGPHINNPLVPAPRAKAAWAALQTAQQRRDRATPTNRALLDALARRYADPQPADRQPLDQAYAEAMRAAHQAHPDDTDIATLYAEALMDLRPWDLWTKDGRSQPGTVEIIATLDYVLRKNPNHPGANHLYIHAVEASPTPARAIAAADRLRNLVPASGHLVHMPSHIDVLTGRWQLAADQNERAIEADRRYREIVPQQGFYRIYMLHNQHMLMFAAMMQGRYDVALRAARAAVAGVPESFLRDNTALADPYMMIVYDVQKRFGRWEELLSEAAPPDYLPITNAMWRFNRAVAFAALGRIAEAEAEQSRFRAAKERVPADAMMAINKAHAILAIAERMLVGEIAYRRADNTTAIAELRAAVRLEDELLYMEPPEWIQPMRHTLAAVLLSAGRIDEAEAVYREDLKRWPENGWSLYGLSRCLAQRGAAQEQADVERRFNHVWSGSDTPIHASCLCVHKP